MLLIRTNPQLSNVWKVNVFCVLLLYIQSTYGQNVIKESFERNSLTVEVLGHSRSLISANYERLFKLSPNYFYHTVRTGIGYTPGLKINSEKHKGTVAVPLVFSLLAGRDKHFAQLSVGYTASFGEDYIDSTTTTPTVHQKFESAYIVSAGYRYMNNGFVVQAYPLLQWTNNPTSKFSIAGGVSIGLIF